MGMLIQSDSWIPEGVFPTYNYNFGFIKYSRIFDKCFRVETGHELAGKTILIFDDSIHTSHTISSITHHLNYEKSSIGIIRGLGHEKPSHDIIITHTESLGSVIQPLDYFMHTPKSLDYEWDFETAKFDFETVEWDFETVLSTFLKAVDIADHRPSLKPEPVSKSTSTFFKLGSMRLAAIMLIDKNQAYLFHFYVGKRSLSCSGLRKLGVTGGRHGNVLSHEKCAPSLQWLRTARAKQGLT